MNCPVCGRTMKLNKDDFYCEKCSILWEYNPEILGMTVKERKFRL
jgi:tRNA(Ile2) C34 agmatinyltransferase TiaS